MTRSPLRIAPAPGEGRRDPDVSSLYADLAGPPPVRDHIAAAFEARERMVRFIDRALEEGSAC